MPPMLSLQNSVSLPRSASIISNFWATPSSRLLMKKLASSNPGRATVHKVGGEGRSRGAPVAPRVAVACGRAALQRARAASFFRIFRFCVFRSVFSSYFYLFLRVLKTGSPPNCQFFPRHHARQVWNGFGGVRARGTRIPNVFRLRVVIAKSGIFAHFL